MRRCTRSGSGQTGWPSTSITPASARRCRSSRRPPRRARRRPPPGPCRSAFAPPPPGSPEALNRLGDLLGEDAAGELGARGHPQLAGDAAQVALDRLGAEEELRAGLAVGRPLGHEQGDLQLLRRELLGRAAVAPARVLTGGGELLAGPVGPGRGADALEDLERGAQVLARLDAPADAAEALAQAELGAR